jgi:protease-4
MDNDYRNPLPNDVPVRPDDAPNPLPPARGSGGAASRVILILAALVLAAVPLFGLLAAAGSLAALFIPAVQSVSPPDGTFSVITVSGSLYAASNDPYSPYQAGYYHDDTVAFVKALAKNEGNAGILLYMNTGGGGVYESDELYTALVAYKEATGRPVWAYMANTCASGGYYVCAAADRIVANPNTTTGSIGVYIALTDVSGLYGKLGIETVLVRSGNNKGVGIEGVPITGEQRAVYQSVVDESYERFISLVASGRGLPLGEVRALSDGRIYTGSQALELGLVDELGEWDAVRGAFEGETGATAFYPSFSRQARIARLMGAVLGELPKSDAESMLKAADSVPAGIPMALYRP